MTFTSNIFIIPGLGNSGEQHWQTLWQNQFGFTRIEQSEWDTPVREVWIDTIEKALDDTDTSNTILVGHSLACATIGFWAQKFGRKIKGALLVGPSDTEADTYPAGTTGFSPMPVNTLPFPTTVVASSNDYYVTLSRAKYFADCWGSGFVNIGDAGHINVASGFGTWDAGLEILKKLDNLTQ